MVPVIARRLSGLARSASTGVDGSPAALSGSMLLVARVLWILIAAGAVVLWFAELPTYYHAALELRNASGMTSLSPDEWRIGLHRLGLSAPLYAGWAVTSISLQTWPMLLMGLVIFLQRSREWIALFISLTFVTLGASIMTNTVGAGLAKAHPTLNLLVGGYANLPYYALFFIPLLFPDGRFVPRWTRWLAALFVLLFSAQALAPGSAADFQTWPALLVTPLTMLFLGTVLVAPVYRYRRVSDAAQREQAKWVIFGLVVAIGVFLAVGLSMSLPPLRATPERSVLSGLIGPTVSLFGSSALSVCFAVAILRYRLWDIDLVLNRTLVYTTLTASIAGLYILVVVGIGAIFRAQGSVLLSLVATVAIGVLFAPLRERLQRGVNRVMYGERDEPYRVISRLGRRLEEAIDPGAALPTIVETVAEALKLPYVAIALDRGEGFSVMAERGAPAGESVRLPLAYQGETIGELIASPRTGTRALSGADLRLLDALAHQAGAAAHAVRLTADLQRSRERLVIAREDERRRLRRDLHDGLGPTLAGLFQRLDVATALVPRDPDAAVTIMDELKGQVKGTIADIRRLVYALRPPTLDEYSLVSAIREGAAQYSDVNGLHISVRVSEPLPALPAAVEVAAYRIALEALTNVVRHAQARTCIMSLSAADDLCLQIVDDGLGLPASFRPGVGVSSMRERAGELGGECAVEPGPKGGVRVRVRLPIAEA